MFRHYPGTISDIKTADRIISNIEKYDRKDALFVFDKGFVSGANMKYLLDKRLNFTAPANTSSKAVKTLLNRFIRTNDSTNMIHDDMHTMYVRRKSD